MFHDLTNHDSPKSITKLGLPDGELNPGLPRDRRGYSPLYYLGFLTDLINEREFVSLDNSFFATHAESSKKTKTQGSLCFLGNPPKD